MLGWYSQIWEESKDSLKKLNKNKHRVIPVKRVSGEGQEEWYRCTLIPCFNLCNVNVSVRPICIQRRQIWFHCKITLILAFNWQPVEQPWEQYQPCLPMIFYPYTEQKELLKAAAVGCSFIKSTGKFALPSLSVRVKEFPILCTLRRIHWVSHQWAGKYLQGKQCPLFPFPCNWSLFTHLFRTQLQRTFSWCNSLSSTDFLFHFVNESLGVGSIYGLSLTWCNTREWPRQCSHIKYQISMDPEGNSLSTRLMHLHCLNLWLQEHLLHN